MNVLRRLTSWRAGNEEIVIVSGLPRSGTSLMMKMLEAGGLPPLTDRQRAADKDNPRGYYEYERVKKLKDGDSAWLLQARGKAVKVISALLTYLPPEYRYKVIFMQRALAEVLASQQKMLVNRGENPGEVSDAEMAQLYTRHLEQVMAWLSQQPNLETLPVSYNDLLADARPQISRVVAFLGRDLDSVSMARVIEPALYRQRASRASA